jgi:phage-related protein
MTVIGMDSIQPYTRNWHHRLKDSERTGTFLLDKTYNILYIMTMINFKPIEFRGSALMDLRDFPVSARREAGYQLDQVQHGGDPDDWKPVNTVGQGVREIRIREDSGAFRVIYVAKFVNAVYVLHCFQKKTEQTSKADIDLAAKRYKELVKEISHER